MSKPRVRFAPSPTGALHIGGVRTALYNYLYAQKTGGTFIIRIEDTDQTRFVPGAEEYILEALEWLGLTPQEGPKQGGAFGPYRQSERKAIYFEYTQKLIDQGKAYYAFDSSEDLDKARLDAEAQGRVFKYDAYTRRNMVNSLTLSAEEVKERLANGTPYTVRLLVTPDEVIHIQDIVRGDVQFQSNELDDKILLKGDGMPTYHLANVVDDHLMEITHVIRGEEWLPSTAHHVLLYRAFGWEDTMPTFAHLPLILKPDGKGKLSKRDGAKLGIPVFPLDWPSEEGLFLGFREFGFLPDAALNFLAFLGWNPGTEQELFPLAELTEAFTLEKIGKSGARFDFDKARWFNQQYIMQTDNETLARLVRPSIEAQGFNPSESFLQGFCALMKERVQVLPDFWENGRYFFERIGDTFDDKPIRKKWMPERRETFTALRNLIAQTTPFDSQTLHNGVEAFMQQESLGHGDVLPILRVSLAGMLKGPAVFDMMALLGQDETVARLDDMYTRFDALT